MKINENPKSDERELASTGRWYEVGRINVCTKIAKSVPWASGTQIVVVYDEVEDEIRIKPLVY